MAYGTFILVIISGILGEVDIPPSKISLLAFNGVFTSALAFSLIFSAVKYISATYISLFLLLETVLGPYLVWLILDEDISRDTIIGSAIIIFTLAMYFMRRLFNSKAKLSDR